MVVVMVGVVVMCDGGVWGLGEAGKGGLRGGNG